MIIRILTEGQFEMGAADVEELDELDTSLTDSFDIDDEPRWRGALSALIAFVRERGTRVPDDDLRPSDAVLPEEDSSAEDVRALLTDEGMIPG